MGDHLVAMSGDLSTSKKAPATLTISSFLPFAKPPPVASPVKRKPLPPNARTSLTPSQSNSSLATTSSPPVPQQELVVRDLDQYPHGHTPLLPIAPTFPQTSETLTTAAAPIPNSSDEKTLSHSLTGSEAISQPPVEQPSSSRRSIGMATQILSGPIPRPDPLTRSFTTNSIDTRAPKTPSSKITSFFTWKNNTSPGAESSSTEISDGRSPLPSPNAPSPQTTAYSGRSVPAMLDINKANAVAGAEGSYMPGLLAPAMITSPDLASKIGLLEGELKEISAELAASIKREMELEDMVEELQSENPQSRGLNHRTSDYFSDSSTSGRTANDHPKREDIERVKRRSEQEKAQLKVSLSQKWQDERTKRKALESHVQLLEDQVASFRREKVDAGALSSKAKELEASLDDARRRLAEERQIKDNFEDLLTALRVDLEQHRHERDNLRDEVVPQLRAQLQASGPGDGTQYDFARMQQEIQALRNENTILVKQNTSRFNTIIEEGGNSPVGLSRSNSLARNPARNSGAMGRAGSLSRSNSLSGRTQESRESLLERMKDVEAQRDALHSAVKSLLERQAYQTRENEKRVRMLEIERDRALNDSSPRRQGYEREVRNLREEINHLRKRADDALEQKWQCEKGLGGLKMDLDRAEQETTSLRQLLQEHDISVPEHISSALEDAFSQLEKERQAALQHKDSSRSLEEEQRLAQQLKVSAQRAEALASQVRQQIDTNQALRDRLAAAVARGEQGQQSSTNKIIDLQTKLRKLEDTVTLAQQHSEIAVAKHEEEVRVLKEAHNDQLQRVKGGLRTPTLFSPTSPMFKSRSPRLGQTSSGPGMPLNEALKIEWLQNKVKELEGALGDADKEMEEVVARMNLAQIEVAELQNERDEALRQTRRLESEIASERQKIKAMISSR